MYLRFVLELLAVLFLLSAIFWQIKSCVIFKNMNNFFGQFLKRSFLYSLFDFLKKYFFWPSNLKEGVCFSYLSKAEGIFEDSLPGFDFKQKLSAASNRHYKVVHCVKYSLPIFISSIFWNDSIKSYKRSFSIIELATFFTLYLGLQIFS